MMIPATLPTLSAFVRRRERIGLLIVVAAVAGILLCLFGCGVDRAAQATMQQAALTQTAGAITTYAASAGTHADNAVTHTDNAFTAVASAVRVANAIPDAAPVLPPLSTASTELAAVKTELAGVKSELSGVQGQVATLTGQVQTLAKTVQTLTDQNAGLLTDKKNLTAEVKQRDDRWNAAWLGGAALFWIHAIEITIGSIFAILFVLEFFLDLPIHPLTWIIKAIPYVVKLTGNVAKGIASAASSAVSAVIGLFKKPPPPPAPAAPGK